MEESLKEVSLEYIITTITLLDALEEEVEMHVTHICNQHLERYRARTPWLRSVHFSLCILKCVTAVESEKSALRASPTCPHATI